MSALKPLRIGTRASALALWQARHVESLVRAQPGAPPVELVHIRTEGDVQSDVPLWQVQGKAFFTKEIDRALLAGTVDIAVHSLKDLATRLEPGLQLAATLPREDPRDALISASGATLSALPRGARVGTSSLRRRAFLARARPDAVLLELRGNVPTRVERLKQGDYDAIILAAAGLKRLGLAAQITEYLGVGTWPPAVAQGVSALLRMLEGGCQVPLGALATVHEEQLSLRYRICALDGSGGMNGGSSVGGHERGSHQLTVEEAIGLGERVARDLLARGAGDLVARARGAHAVEEP